MKLVKISVNYRFISLSIFNIFNQLSSYVHIKLFVVELSSQGEDCQLHFIITFMSTLKKKREHNGKFVFVYSYYCYYTAVIVNRYLLQIIVWLAKYVEVELISTQKNSNVFLSRFNEFRQSNQPG